MLNYIRAELFKAFHRKAVYLLLASLLAGEMLFCLLWHHWPSTEFLNMVSMLTLATPVGLCLTIPLVHFVVSDPYRNDVLKNEVSFGLPRERIYLGKLIASGLVCLLVCGAAVGAYLGGNWLICAHSPETGRESLALAEGILLASLPLWLGMLGLSVLVFLTAKNSTTGIIILLLGLSMVPVVFDLLTCLNFSWAKAVGEWGLRLSLITASDNLPASGVRPDDAVIRWNWVLGMIWLLGSTAAGMPLFRRHEM